LSAWGRAEFGEPCRACGFNWGTPVDEAGETVASAGHRFAARLVGEDGGRRHPDLGWTVTGYVCHVGDSIRVWSERIATVALGSPGAVAPYSQNLLAEARHYDEVDLSAALWSLERAVGDWLAALALVGDRPFTMHHEELGAMSLADVIGIRAHDVTHHAWDIERILA
jgi:hypothetical protein